MQAAMRAGTGMKFSFVRRGKELVASLTGGAETPQKAHARDIFFTPGHGATPKVFQRADNGKIIGFIYLCGKNSIVFRHVVECSILTCFPGRVRHFGAPSRRGRFPSRSG